MDEEYALEIYRRLKTVFNYELKRKITSIRRDRDPFRLLIATILSQNTNDRNSSRAFERLRREVGIEPLKLANADIRKIEEAIKIGGLYRVKAKVIKKLAKTVLKTYRGDLSKLLTGSLDEARSKLMSLPGVGAKTADIVLLFAKDLPTLPVDTHVNRVSKRLGLAPFNADYEEVRRNLMDKYPQSLYLEVHLLFILLGRTYCKSRNPSCLHCPLRDICPSAKL